MSIIHLNGAWVPAAEARVSVLDRGFLFGDGVYEVIPVFAGRIFCAGRHLRRLARSLQAVAIPAPYDDQGWLTLLQELVQRNGGGDQALYLQVTRGVAARDHLPPAEMTPAVFAMANPLKPRTAIPEVRVATSADNRWDRCDIKSIALLPNVLLRLQAAAEDFDDSILVREGVLTEGTASNVFVVLDGVVCTPPCSNHLLPGITREVLLECMHQAGIDCVEREIAAEELKSASEIWLTSSTREVVAVRELDRRPVGDGNVGPLCRKADSLYQALKSDCQVLGQELSLD